MRNSLIILLDDEDILELMRILMDSDQDGALEFVRFHMKGKATELLEGG